MAHLPLNAQQLYVSKDGIRGRDKEVQDGHMVSMACHKKGAVSRADSKHLYQDHFFHQLST